MAMRRGSALAGLFQTFFTCFAKDLIAHPFSDWSMAICANKKACNLSGVLWRESNPAPLRHLSSHKVRWNQTKWALPKSSV